MASVNVLNDEELIVAVQARQAIYDKSDKNHCNRNVIANLWTDISAELGFDALTCKTRWNSIRDYFLRKFREKSRSGQAASSKRKWPLYDNMSFLVPYITPRDTSGNLEAPTPESVDDDESVISADDAAADAPTPGPSTAQQTNSMRQKKKRTAKEAEVENEILRALKEPPMTEIEHFFKSLIPTVSKLDDISKMEFQRDVQDLVVKYARRQHGYSTTYTRRPTDQSQHQFSVYSPMDSYYSAQE